MKNLNKRISRSGLLTDSHIFQLPITHTEIINSLRPDIQEFIARIGPDSSELNALNFIYDLSRQPAFRLLYKEILIWLSRELDEVFIYQPHPTFRIQWPGTRAGYFHIDSWVGHGPSTVNIWVPITDLSASSSVWMASRDDTDRIKTKILNYCLSIKEYEDIARPLMSPMIVPLGHCMTFNDCILHGSIPLSDPLPRISFDFRLAFEPFDIGIKVKGRDYVNDLFQHLQVRKEEKMMKRVKTIVFTNASLSHLSHSTQRQIIQDFCIQNNLLPYREASEFYGFNHLPQISEWISNELLVPVDEREPIVLASAACFENIDSIIDSCREACITLYDALANYKIC